MQVELLEYWKQHAYYIIIQFNFSIIYAFWDEEEIGANGSEYFAEQANSAGMNIGGVLNFEMSGWDSNDDGLIDIHTRRSR